MSFDKIIRKYKPILEKIGFKYSWFPNEHSFIKDNVFIVIVTFQYGYTAIYNKKMSKMNKFSFNFQNIVFKDDYKNDFLKKIYTEKDIMLSLNLLFEFIVDNVEWILNLSKNDYLEKNQNLSGFVLD